MPYRIYKKENGKWVIAKHIVYTWADTKRVRMRYIDQGYKTKVLKLAE